MRSPPGRTGDRGGGHSLIKTQMVETVAPLAGEMSGHIFLRRQVYGYDDASCRHPLLGIVARWDGQTLAQRRDGLPHMVNTPEMADCRNVSSGGGRGRDRLRAEGAKVNAIDGVRVDTPDGWWLLRASNTQAVLVARCEATSAEGLQRLRAALEAQLTKSAVALPH